MVKMVDITDKAVVILICIGVLLLVAALPLLYIASLPARAIGKYVSKRVKEESENEKRNQVV